MRVVVTCLGFLAGLVLWAIVCQSTFGSPPPTDSPTMGMAVWLGIVIASETAIIAALLCNNH